MNEIFATKQCMETAICIFSEAFCPSEIASHYNIPVSKSLWEKIVNDQTGGRSFLRIQFNQKDFIAPLGSPVDDGCPNNVYLRMWMLDTLGVQGTGEEATCLLLDHEAFPQATKLTLRVVDSAFYTSEVKEELEMALSALGVVKKQMLLQLPIANLGGFHVEVFVSNTEPADIVLCEGEEVAVEFEEPVDHYEEPVVAARPPTPIPPNVPIFTEEMIVPPTTEDFVPFQGQGHTLGATAAANSCIPEWRQKLGPPRQYHRG